MNISEIRKSYLLKKLTSKELKSDPLTHFKEWFHEALECKIDEVNAIALATVDSQGQPSCRMVLLKGIEDTGLIFFTNYESRKAKELEGNPNAALTIWWKEIERQVRFEGKIEKCSSELTEKYFAKRPRRSQLSAWASEQSKPIPSRELLEQQFINAEKQFEGKDVPPPPNWGGYRLVPHAVEFWQGREDRLHDRFLYVKKDGSWSAQRLSP